MSMIKNLRDIKENGIEGFLRKEKKKWRCLDCGDRCCHNGLCLNCEIDKLRKNRKYHWNEE